jgi:hypothetical protein
MDAIAFDIDGFKRAFEAGEPERILQFYSPDLEHVEIDQDAPPASQRTTGFDEISQAFEGIAQAGMPLRRTTWWTAGTAPRARSRSSSRTAVACCRTRSST